MSRRDKLKVNEPSTLGSPSSFSPNALSQLKSEIMSDFSAMLKSIEERILQKLGDIAAEVSNLRSELQTSKNKINSLTKRCENSEYELKNLRKAFNKIENASVASDIVLMNVPNELDAAVVVDKLTSAISCRAVVRKVFRTHSCAAADKSVPIIVKLNTSDDRVEFFKLLSLFRKEKKKQLTLADFGFADGTKLFVHECLSSLNRELLQNAIRLKNNKLLVSAYSLRGDVYVKTKIDGKPLKLSCVEDLNKVVGA